MRILTRTMVLVMLLLIPGVCAAEPEVNQESGSEAWQTPLVIPAAAFATNGANRESFFHSPNGYITGSGTSVLLVAPVYLPNGATVTRLAARVYDNSTSCGSSEIIVWLNRVGANAGTGMSTMATTLSSGASSSMQTIDTTAITNPSINNFSDNLYVAVMLCSYSHELHSVIIEYLE